MTFAVNASWAGFPFSTPITPNTFLQNVGNAQMAIPLSFF